MAYTTESSVYSTTQLSSQILQDTLQMSESEVTTWVTARIARAQGRLREDIALPYVVRNELYLATGYSNIFELGDSDDPTTTFLGDDIIDNLDEIKRVYFGSYKKLLPFPNNCDIYTDYSSPSTDGWSSYVGATITGDSTVVGAGDYSVKIQADAADYIQFPDNNYFDMMINQYTDMFFWIRTSDLNVTITFRMYDTDGNYSEQVVTPRLVNQGMYYWIDIKSMTDVGDVDWSNKRFQYFRIYLSDAVTIYFDNWCLTDSWASSAPQGLFHVVKADNISTSSYPPAGYPYKLTYTYDPFLANTPSHIAEATDWLTGVMIIDALRDRKYGLTDFMLWSDTMEQDIPMQGSGILAIRRYMMQNYLDCLGNYGGKSWGYIP